MNYIKKSRLSLTMFMILCTGLKLYFFYCNTLFPENKVHAFISTSLLLIVIYFLINQIIFVKSSFPILIVHMIFSFIFLSDILYFKHFQTFLTLNDLGALDMLPSIISSIISLLDIKYLLLFADLLFLIPWIYISKCNQNTTRYTHASTFAILILCFITFLDLFTMKSNKGIQIYDNYGLIHYHLSQPFWYLGIENRSTKERNIDLNPPVDNWKQVGNIKYFGTAKGKNVIVIQVEALQGFVIHRKYNGQELTPNLNRLISEDSIYFNRYYQQLGKGNTSDAEFVTQNSVYPSTEGSAYKMYSNNSFYGLPAILKDKGYETKAFHAYKAEYWNRDAIYPSLGFEEFYSMKDFIKDEVIGWGVSDESFFRQSVKYLNKTKKPFYAFLVTLSSHHPYELPDKYKHINLLKEHEGTLQGGYLQAIHYADLALGSLIDQLKENNLYDNSVIAIYGDHYSMGCLDPENKAFMEKILGYEYDYDEMLKVPLIIHIPGSGIKETNSVTGGQVDFLPTMLNLLGIKQNQTKYFGRDLNNIKKGFALSLTYMTQGSFVDDEKAFEMSKDGIFENGRAWSLSSRSPVTLEECRTQYEKALIDIEESEYLLKNNLLLKQELKANNNIKKPGFIAYLKQILIYK